MHCAQWAIKYCAHTAIRITFRYHLSVTMSSHTGHSVNKRASGNEGPGQDGPERHHDSIDQNNKQSSYYSSEFKKLLPDMNVDSGKTLRCSSEPRSGQDTSHAKMDLEPAGILPHSRACTQGTGYSRTSENQSRPVNVKTKSFNENRTDGMAASTSKPRGSSSRWGEFRHEDRRKQDGRPFSDKSKWEEHSWKDSHKQTHGGQRRWDTHKTRWQERKEGSRSPEHSSSWKSHSSQKYQDRPHPRNMSQKRQRRDSDRKHVPNKKTDYKRTETKQQRHGYEGQLEPSSQYYSASRSHTDQSAATQTLTGQHPVTMAISASESVPFPAVAVSSSGHQIVHHPNSQVMPYFAQSQHLLHHANQQRFVHHSNTQQFVHHSNTQRFVDHSGTPRFVHHSNTQRFVHPSKAQRFVHHSNTQRFVHHSQTGQQQHPQMQQFIGQGQVPTDKGQDRSDQRDKGTVKKRKDHHKFWYRRWSQVPGMSSEETEGKEFTLASYNVLAQNLLEDHPYLYRTCDQDHLTWNHRSQKLYKEIKSHRPDILCMQEVNAEHYQDFFTERLRALGYESTYKRRTGDKQDGCAIFYNQKKFRCTKMVPVEFYRRGEPLFDRDNVGIVCELTGVEKGWQDVKLCVATTHLLYNPKRGDIKLAQLCLLLAEVDKVAYIQGSGACQPRYIPTIFCGDFNLEPDSDLYRFLRTGELQYDGLAASLMSGQSNKEQRYLDKRFLPRTLGITDNCQYRSEVQKRMNDADSIVLKSAGSCQDTESSSLIDLTNEGSAGVIDLTGALPLGACDTYQPMEVVEIGDSSQDESDLELLFTTRVPESCKEETATSQSDDDDSVKTRDAEVSASVAGNVVSELEATDDATVSGEPEQENIHCADSADVNPVKQEQDGSEPVQCEMDGAAPDEVVITSVTVPQLCTQSLPSCPPGGSGGTSDRPDTPDIDRPVQRDLLRVGSGVLTHSLNLSSVYDSHRDPAQRIGQLVSTMHGNEGALVDFIFYSQEKCSSGCDAENTVPAPGVLKLCSRLELVTRSQLKRKPSLPNEVIGSDHLLLMAKLALIKNGKS